jgi:NAD(P)-dependent dehydrogenase (short-subunit alcohol dehydrogenase family)
MKTALITGAGDGIGLATAWRLAREGYTVLATGRTPEPLEALVAGLRAAGHSARALAVDVTDAAAASARLGGLGAVDLLVANAGVCHQARLDAPDADQVWREVLSTNLDGAWNTLRAVGPHIPPGGRVILVSSGLGKLGRPGYAAYCASKHGVLGLMRALALELAPRAITVNAVCPGWVDTRMARADLDRTAAREGIPASEARARAEAAIPVGRFVRPEEVADLIAFLASDAAAASTGQACNLSGGEFGL